MLEDVGKVGFWSRVLEIIGIDVLLSGDNAVLIALACRSLPPRQQRIGIVLGAAAAVALRIVFAAFVVQLLEWRWLKLGGGLLLFWIAFKLVRPSEAEDAAHVESGATLIQAVRNVMIADAVMSLDNVLAISAAAKGSVGLLVFGLAVSIPLVVYGSTLVMKLLERFPVVVVAGAGLLGYIAGEVIVGDPVLTSTVDRLPHAHTVAPWLGCVLLVAVGLWERRQPGGEMASST